MSNTLRKTIVIMGPTASGKSDLAITLAKKYNGEIISSVAVLDSGSRRSSKETLFQPSNQTQSYAKHSENFPPKNSLHNSRKKIRSVLKLSMPKIKYA